MVENKELSSLYLHHQRWQFLDTETSLRPKKKKRYWNVPIFSIFFSCQSIAWTYIYRLWFLILLHYWGTGHPKQKWNWWWIGDRANLLLLGLIGWSCFHIYTTRHRRVSSRHRDRQERGRARRMGRRSGNAPGKSAAGNKAAGKVPSGKDDRRRRSWERRRRRRGRRERHQRRENNEQ